MTIAIMQPYIFPYIGYFQLIEAVDVYVIFDDVQHIKRGWINRNNILVNGQEYRFTIALDRPSTTKLINETYIKDDFSAFLKTIQQNYSKAPFYNQTIALLTKICSFEDRNLALFATNSLEVISSYLGIDTKFRNSSDIKTGSGLKGQERILAICRELGATHYVNAIGGRELYGKQVFAENDIQLNFIKSGEITYQQFSAPFVPNLSVIDVMMFNSPSDIKKMLENYELV